MNVSEFIQRSDLFAVHSCNRGAEQLAREINIWGEMRYYESNFVKISWRLMSEVDFDILCPLCKLQMVVKSNKSEHFKRFQATKVEYLLIQKLQNFQIVFTFIHWCIGVRVCFQDM